MSRGRYYHDPARKHLEQYQDFSGGLNTVASNENLKNNELTMLENVDLGDRGSLKRRKGFKGIPTLFSTGKAQMIHRFRRNFTPYNLLGHEGSFDGIKKQTGSNVSIGGWYVFNLPDEANAYKVDREEASQLVVNGDFENGDYGWDLNIDKGEVGDSLVGRSLNAYSGGNVLRVRSWEGHSGTLNEYQTYDNEISVTAGQVIYAETMHRRAAKSIGNVPYRVHLVASVKLSNGSRQRIYKSAYNTNYEWQKISGDFLMPSGAVSVIFGVGILDNDTSQDIAAYFDNVKAFRKSGNLAYNGDFELGDTGWDFDIDNTLGDSLIGRSALAYSGQNVMRIRRFLGSTGHFNEYQSPQYDTAVKEGDRLTASVRYREAARSIGAKPYRVHLIASVLKEDGTRERFYANRYDTNDTWKLLEHTFRMPKDAVSVRFGLGIIDNASQVNVAAYFDDFKLHKQTQLIENSDFEDGENGWELDVDALRAGDSLVGNSAVSYSGKDVLRIRRYKGHGGFYNEYQDFDKEIKVQEGEEIYAEAMYRGAVPSIGSAPYRIHLIASVKKKNGSRERFYVNKYDADNTWKKVSGYFIMPKNAVSVVLGVGIIDNASDRDVAAYFDDIYARKEIQGSSNSAVAIRSSTADTATGRGLGYSFEGIEPNKHYVYLVDFKTEGVTPKGGLAIRDERYGIVQTPETLIGFKQFDGTEDWSTQYLKFRTGSGVTQARAYVYNYSPLGTLNTAYYDNARIFEVSPEVYEQIGDTLVDVELAERFPYRVGQLSRDTLTETIVARGGKFYLNGNEVEVQGDVPIQSERTMEAASYGDNLYIASGSGLLVYNGSVIAPIEPYIPDNLETLYIGSNALIPNAYYISDVEQSVVELKQIRFGRRYGVTNKDINLEVSVGKPGNVDIHYLFERRNVRDKEDYWEIIKDWSRDSYVTFKTNIAGEYQFRISVRDAKSVGDEEDDEGLILDQYEIPKYIIKPTSDDSDSPIDGNTMDSCNRILVHWDRLLLYGDEVKKDVLYISDLYNPEYFPVNNTLQFENPRKERITNMTRYRGNLVVFTESSTQALYGTHPENFERIMLNTDVGCIADRSPQVVHNSLIFLSYDGITMLRTVGTSESKANVSMIDTKIKNLVEFSDDAVGYVRNNQYHLVYPSSRFQLRYYYDWDVWTSDKSPSLDFTDVFVEDNKVYAIGEDARFIEDWEQYHDEGYVYESIVATKLFDFGEPYATKKTRELHMMFDTVENETSLDVNTYIDVPYEGKVEILSESYERSVDKLPEAEAWVTVVKPTHPDTLHKEFSYDVFEAKTTPRESMKDFAKRKGAVIALSASAGITGGWQGLQVKNGEVYQIQNQGQRIYETAAIMKDGTMKIIEYGLDIEPDLTDVKHTFHFGPYMIKDGVKRETYPDMNDFDYIVTQKHPRQGMGMRADGSYVFITVDGRSDIAPGVDLYEFADMFEAQGCVVAYNLDGGGSAQTVVDGEYIHNPFELRNRRDFIYFTKDNVEIIESDRSGIVKSENLTINSDSDFYEMIIPGKGKTVGTFISHEDNNPVKFVGLSYVFKLKKP